VEHPIPQFLGDVSGGENSITTGAVDPTDADRVYLRSSGALDGGESRLYVTTDGGATFRVAKDFQVEGAGLALAGELAGFALSPDGSKIFVGTRESGLWSAARSDMAFSQVNANVAVLCLATRQTAKGPELWACGNEYKGPPGNPGNFIVGRSIDDGVTFEAKLPTLTTLGGIAQCAAPSGGSMACGATANTPSCGCDDYQSFCSNTEAINACLGCGMSGADAGATDASGPQGDGGADAGVKVRASGSSCSCDASGEGDARGAAVALALTAIALARRTRPRTG
jgi:MYXO-CTERM domain-containing protein